jgi:hypothetical protein
MTMVFCRGCGKELHETAAICPHCGFVQPIQSVLIKDSQWMSVTALILSVMCFLNWLNLADWDKDVKSGLWILSISSLALAVTSIQQKRSGNIFSFISIAVVVITMLILIGKST